jgi:hypothetical protein
VPNHALLESLDRRASQGFVRLGEREQVFGAHVKITTTSAFSASGRHLNGLCLIFETESLSDWGSNRRQLRIRNSNVPKRICVKGMPSEMLRWDSKVELW